MSPFHLRATETANAHPIAWSVSRESFEQSPRTETSDRVCAPISDCPEGLFEVEAPTATSDRICASSHDCGEGKYEKAAPTPTRDRVCEEYTQCNEDEYERVAFSRSEEHTSELQSRGHLACRLLLETK